MPSIGYTQWHQCFTKGPPQADSQTITGANGAPTDGDLSQGVFVGDCSAVGVFVRNATDPIAGTVDVRVWLQFDNSTGVWHMVDWLGTGGTIGLTAATPGKSGLFRVDTYGAQRLYVEALNFAAGATGVVAICRGGTGNGGI